MLFYMTDVINSHKCSLDTNILAPKMKSTYDVKSGCLQYGGMENASLSCGRHAQLWILSSSTWEPRFGFVVMEGIPAKLTSHRREEIGFYDLNWEGMTRLGVWGLAPNIDQSFLAFQLKNCTVLLKKWPGNTIDWRSSSVCFGKVRETGSGQYDCATLEYSSLIGWEGVLARNSGPMSCIKHIWRRNT